MARPKPRKSKPYIPQPSGIAATTEAQRHGIYEVHVVEKNGPKVHRNMSARVYDRMHRKGKITTAQKNAADTFYALCIAAGRHVGSGARDSLDMSPRGGTAHETDAQVARIIDAKRKLKRIEDNLADGYINILQLVVIDDQSPCRQWRDKEWPFRAFVCALDEVINTLGLQRSVDNS